MNATTAAIIAYNKKLRKGNYPTVDKYGALQVKHNKYQHRLVRYYQRNGRDSYKNEQEG